VGYVNRKVLVRFEDGTIGEIQLWAPHMPTAKDGEGHALYKRIRATISARPRRRR